MTRVRCNRVRFLEVGCVVTIALRFRHVDPSGTELPRSKNPNGDFPPTLTLGPMGLTIKVSDSPLHDFERLAVRSSRVTFQAGAEDGPHIQVHAACLHLVHGQDPKIFSFI